MFAQTDGITYQAVIISPDPLELPGVDSEGNYLPNTTIAIRFTIYDSGNQIEFQEVQITDTDEFGRINLLIGDADHDYFKEISWDGTPKDLKVEIDFDAGNNFETMSRERLTFLPYAYHRNITATGTLTVDDRTFLNGELQVEGPTNLQSTLDVNNGNATNLTGTLNVDGVSDFNEALNVNNGSPTTLSGDVTIGGNSVLNGTLDVIGMTTLNDLTVNGEASFGDLAAETLLVNQSTILNGTTRIDGMGSQIHLTSNFPNIGTDIANHPVLIDGGKNGLAIKVNGNRENDTNFITFFDDARIEPWGRIEGETEAEFTNNADYNFDKRSLNYDSYDAIFDTSVSAYEFAKSLGEIGIASTSSTGCVGFGACVTAPIPSWIIGSTAQSIVAALQIVASAVGVVITQDNINTYDDNRVTLQGVTYASGAGDYAEYLLRENYNEKMTYGDIVGVKGGKISKNLESADRMMVVSYKPIVLGNMPKPDREAEYEKVAFMGQVPVNVFGKVEIGDYILPSGKNDGVGIAIKPSDIVASQLKNIVGVAWSQTDNTFGISKVNVAVGVNKNDSGLIIEKLENKVNQQAREITTLKNQIENILVKIAAIEEGANEGQLRLNSNTDEHQNNSKYKIIESTESDIIYYDITRDDFEKGLLLAEEMILGADVKNEKVIEALNKLKTDLAFKNKFFKRIQDGLSKQIHFHQEIDKKGRH
ncbi:hypothetical protein CA834_11335 [Winogradskyella aurantia]|uniref:Peptidase S74 domain-containing protein n=2 Tax=Winogradskyella aurantia TaxID=1915063 RepID=A0A265UR20_9FLAO|nr:hypothetical protein CA834_11335 [Winogradskyella aurantia]